MEVTLRDLWTAISNLMLELSLTGLLVLALFLGGWFLRYWSLKKRLKAHHIYQDYRVAQETATDAANFWHGISTELFGAVITTICFGIVLLIFQQFQAIQNRKAELVLQMGSPDHAFAIEAVRQLSALGWLYDKTLVGTDLESANLAGADLWSANLAGAILSSANLAGADLEFANLAGADLWSANLIRVNSSSANLLESDLSNANLLEADLSYVDLSGADLSSANLRGADLSRANLRGADLSYEDLSGVFLWEANLSSVHANNVDLFGADLSYVNLSYASLWNVNLSGAYLWSTNLSGVDLGDSNLSGVDLGESNLLGANLSRVTFSDRTLLPDAQYLGKDENGNPLFDKYYDPELGPDQMLRYTDPNHPDFWDPCIEIQNYPWCGDKSN